LEEKKRDMPLVSVIIPNWNGLDHLPVCLESLRHQALEGQEIIVVDNGSSDDSVEWVRTEHPDVTMLALGENQGFVGACNAGIAASQGEFVALLNNDTEVDRNWLAAIVDAFERYPEAGMVASKMLLFDRRDTFHTAGDFYRVNGLPGNRGVWQEDIGQYDQEEYVFSACGGSAAYRRAMLDEIGLLDEDFFFSCEDIDLGWRAQLAGWRCIYTPEAIVYHKLSATGSGPLASFHNGRNMIYLLAKDFPAALWRRYWPQVLRAQIRTTSEALRAWRGEAARARIKGQLTGLLGVPRMLRKRRHVQRLRSVDQAYLDRILTGVDETP
jgi:GT2 family glycosyltransferase